MKREEEIVNYAMSFQGKGIESEENKSVITEEHIKAYENCRRIRKRTA